ncbi:MAG: aspartate 1-decarboxylase [Micrococcales bacterium]|nr:aspartate 1-decarboxylase [Micrococcales bacterium]
MAVLRPMLLSKIHRATVTAADLDYVGSISLDDELLQAVDLFEGQQVDVLDITNGARLTTYVIRAEAGSGTVAINGAAAHLVHTGDLIIVLGYGLLDESTAQTHLPKVAHVDTNNRIIRLGHHPGQ